MASRERSIRVEAVVLRHSDWGEADRLLWLYTREQGKLKAIAKGVRKARSRKAGHLEPFTRISLQLARGRDLWIVTQVETSDAYLALREDLLRVGYAFYVIELLDRFTYEEGENAALFSLLADTLHRLNTDDQPLLSVRYYEVRLLDYLGFRPLLFQCAACDNPIQPQDQYFSAAQGGIMCPECGRHTPGVVKISVEALRYLRHFQRSSYAEAARANPTVETYREMETIMQGYLTYLLERGLNTPEFLRRLRAENDARAENVPPSSRPGDTSPTH